MAGHLAITQTEDIELFNKVNKVLNTLGVVGLKIMPYFQKIKHYGITFQRLSSEYKLSEDDGEIFSIINWHFKSSEYEQEGCNIEVHLTKEGKIRQLYLVA